MEKDKTCYPVAPADPGQHALQARSEALDRQEKREEYFRAHPLESVPSGMWNGAGDDWTAIERGDKLLDLGGGTFEAGDALIPRR